jgi:DNA-binding NtrC family response regulator
VKQSGGYIWVYSESGKGTTFKIYLPRVTETAESPALIAAPAESVATEPGTESILLVEDEANLRYLARQYLEKQGYRVLEAADGAVAVQIAVAHEGTIHLLLTDVIMPGMNGVELAGVIRERYPGLPVVLTSGYSHVLAENAHRGFELIQKPYSVESLSRILRKAISERTAASRG